MKENAGLVATFPWTSGISAPPTIAITKPATPNLVLAPAPATQRRRWLGNISDRLECLLGILDRERPAHT